MHTATCFDSKESSSGYSLNHIVGISSTVHILGSQKVYIEVDIRTALHYLGSQVLISSDGLSLYTFWDPRNVYIETDIRTALRYLGSQVLISSDGLSL